ncbi:MAG: STAS domain-containing protein [Chromatiales bacterium]|nr:STAS domain-containing protein [Chromatiales bacterium]
MGTVSFNLVAAADGLLSAEGELSLVTVEAALILSRHIFQQQQGDVTVDLGEVSRADSAGLALLILWVRELRGRGRTLTFVHTPPHLLRLAGASNLSNILPFSLPELLNSNDRTTQNFV